MSVFNLATHESLQSFKAPSLTAAAKVVGVLWILTSTFGGHPSGSSEVWSRAPSGPVVFSSTGSHLAMVNSAANTDTALGQGKQQVRVFDLSNPQLVSTVAYNADIASIAFSPDGRWIATAGQGVDVWDWQESPGDSSFRGGPHPIPPAAFAIAIIWAGDSLFLKPSSSLPRPPRKSTTASFCWTGAHHRPPLRGRKPRH